ncbi:piriformospora indica-insensitive protein 2-like [Chenopodium quinoa]|uniref:Piriformospora indica-insensitive protein 2 n=1 Tax=Chenopodium quinoa TaxID=63459 RepID=A0A803M9A9_CHEQI|nr:piriformospora indica-insensitive protein 2-like [Chenopodium quinoa]
MAFSLSSSSSTLFFTLTLFSLLLLSHHQQQQFPPLNSAEQESVYLALESINPEIQWRTLYPDDLCLSAPHGVICDYLPNPNSNDTVFTPHIVELNFGYVLDSSDNPPCSSNSSFPLSLSSFSHLRKLFFYRCFTGSPVLIPSLKTVSSELEELVFMENPALFGSLSGIFGNFTSLRRFILTGSNVSGGVPDEITKLPSLEQLTISGNRNLGMGMIPNDLGCLEKLRVLDLSRNGLTGTIPNSLGNLKFLLKLDLSCNNFVGKIPEDLKNLQNLEFLDLGFNKFGNFGIPLFLGNMPRLREVYLSGNPLGGAIPEIWKNLRGILGIGLSGVGLVGNIPSSMGVFLTNVSYIGLDNNKLEGTIPKELGLLEHVNEMNLQNNQLSGGIPFSAPFVARIGGKLKLEGNSGICLDKSMKWSVDQVKGSLRNLRICSPTTENPNAALFVDGNGNGGVSLSRNWYLVFVLGVFWSIYLVGG